MRVRLSSSDEAEVPISPLIDCVFLLLIFFLVTTMFKRFEKQIPVTLPDSTSSLSRDARDQTVVVGLDEYGRAYRTVGKDNVGTVGYQPVGDLALYLKQVYDRRGADVPLLLSADRDTEFQTVIDALDLAQLQGFKDVEVRMRQRTH